MPQHENSIIFCAVGGAETGMGHIMRCQTLARELRDRGVRVMFLVQDDSFLAGHMQAAGFAYRLLRQCATHDAMLEQCLEAVREMKPAAVVLDVISSRTEHVRAMQAAGCVVVGLDDLGEGALALDAHLAVDAAVVRAPASGRLFAGPRYVIISRELLAHRPERDARQAPDEELYVGFGGSDARGMTLPAVRALAAWDARFHASVVLGPCVADPDAVERACAGDSRFTVYRDPPDLFRIMARASLAVCSVGQGMFELACLGVPSVVVSLSELHVRMAANFAALGCIEHLGAHNEFNGADLASRCRNILNDTGRWRAMRDAGLRAVDGHGARRICDVILELTGGF